MQLIFRSKHLYERKGLISLVQTMAEEWPRVASGSTPSRLDTSLSRVSTIHRSERRSMPTACSPCSDAASLTISARRHVFGFRPCKLHHRHDVGCRLRLAGSRPVPRRFPWGQPLQLRPQPSVTVGRRLRTGAGTLAAADLAPPRSARPGSEPWAASDGNTVQSRAHPCRR